MPPSGRARASRPALALKSCMPWNGMQWGQGRASITHRRRVDIRVVEALRSLGVSIRKRDVQIELTNLVEEATALAQRVVSVPGRDVERSEFLLELHQRNRLGRLLSLDQFEQFFTTLVLARYRYLEERWEAELPAEDPATHCHLARAVDAFEAAAWFWSTPEAFIEDDQTRWDDAERGVASPSSDSSDGEDQDRAAASSAADTIAAAPAAGFAFAAAAATSTSVAAANDPAYVSLAAGVDAMDLDDDVAGAVGSEMEVDG